MLYPTLDSHIATLGLRFGLRWCGVGYPVVAFGAVRPAVAMLDGVDVALTHAELPVSLLRPAALGLERMFPQARGAGVPDTPHRMSAQLKPPTTGR